MCRVIDLDYILVSLKYGDKTDDLRVPSFSTVAGLISILNDIYGFSGNELHAEPRGIILDRNKSLAEQGVLHGALLTLD